MTFELTPLSFFLLVTFSRNPLMFKWIYKINVCCRIMFSLTFKTLDSIVHIFFFQNCHHNPRRTDHRVNWKLKKTEKSWNLKNLLFEGSLLSSNNTANGLNKGKNSMLISWSPLLEWEMDCGNKVTASCIRTWNCPQNWQMLLISGQTQCCQKSPFEADFVDVHRH